MNTLIEIGMAIWRASWQASVLALLVVAVQLAFGRRIPARWRHTMWMLVLVRLALPVVPSSPLSVFNLAPTEPAQTVEVPVPQGIEEGVVHIVRHVSDSAKNVERRTADVVSHPPPPLVNEDAGPIPWSQLLAWCWVAGAALLALRVAWATLRVSWMMRTLRRVDVEVVVQVLHDTAAELRVRRLPVLLTGDGFFNPALVGFIRPRLLLPADLLRGFEPSELRLVFLHELAHLKRRDVAINWFATILTVLHWPNPVAWLVAWRLRLERELACDELVLSAASGDAERRAYGHTIVKLLETFSRAARPMPGAVGILEGKQQMKRRITMIAKFGRNTRGSTVVAALMVLGLGVVALTDAVNAEPPAVKSESTPGPSASVKPDSAAVEIGTDAAVLADPRTMQLTHELDELRESRARLLNSRDEKHPEVIAADKRIAQRERALRELQAAYAAAATRPVTIGAQELVSVSIMDLVGPGVETVKNSRVDADGNINLPHVGLVKALGMTALELEKAISEAYAKKGILKAAFVAVSLPLRGESHSLSSRRETAADPGMMGPGGRALGMRGGMAPAHAAPAPVDPALAALLDKKLPEVTFDGVGLSDVTDFLRDVSSANLFVDWRALEAAGIDRNAPVTARLRDIAFKDALALILRSVDPGLHFQVENNVIQIGVNATKKAEKLEVKAYDVADLVEPDVANQMQEFVKVVCQNVQPETWSLEGGTGRVNALGTRIVVTASKSVHDDVVALLKTLRETPKTKSAAAEKAARGTQARELWESKYKPRIFVVGGKSNFEEIANEFMADIQNRFGEDGKDIARPKEADLAK